MSKGQTNPFEELSSTRTRRAFSRMDSRMVLHIEIDMQMQKTVPDTWPRMQEPVPCWFCACLLEPKLRWPCNTPASHGWLQPPNSGRLCLLGHSWRLRRWHPKEVPCRTVCPTSSNNMFTSPNTLLHPPGCSQERCPCKGACKHND